MELSVPPALVYVASWASVTGGVWALFDRAETVATEEAKQAVARWLRNLDPAGPLEWWPATFAAVFDRVFGARHLSWRCFGRSCVASVASVAILTGLWVVLRRAAAPAATPLSTAHSRALRDRPGVVDRRLHGGADLCAGEVAPP